MGRTYKPAAESPPLDWDTITKRITAYVRENHDRLSGLLASDLEDHPKDEELPIDLAELEVLLLQLFARYVAEPTRPPNYTRTAIRQIGKNPDLLHTQHDELDPEAVARVLGAYARDSRSAEADVFAFEQSAGKLDPDRIRHAAQIALTAMPVKNSKGGRSTHEIQRWFADGLARIYLRNNPRIDRIVHGPERTIEYQYTRSPGDGDPVILENTAVTSRSKEFGKCKDFVTDVVRFVKATDPALGAILTVDSIVRIASNMGSKSDAKGYARPLP